MLRYKRLLNRSLSDTSTKKAITLRDLAKQMEIPVPSLHNYVQFDTLPRIDNIRKMADHYNESISSLFSEDDDQTAMLIRRVRNLSPAQKQKLLTDLEHNN